MEEYPDEFRTPPLPLVALVGLPEFHLQVTHYLRAEQPPLATVSISDAAGAGILAGKERRPPDARLPPPLGVLKAGWLAKHRQRAASVAVAFFPRERVFGDPSQWLAVCTQVDAIKAAIRGRNIKVVIAIAQAAAGPLDTSEERMLALRKRAETEARCCVPFVTGDVAQLRTSLSSLAKLVGELAANYYREEGRRIKTRIEKKAYSSPELSVRYNFKIAVYAEFRRDWVAAVKYYNAAYTLLHEVPTPPQELQPVQRLVEAKSVAEILHLKLVTLLLHSGNTLEAVTQLRRHMAWYRAREGPPEGSFLHWAWVSKQYKVFGELLQSRLAVVSEKPASGVGGVVAAVAQAGSDREQQPAFYFQLAASCAVKRRQTFEAALSIAQTFGDLDQEDILAGGAEKVGPPLYIGQAPRVLGRGFTPETQRPTEAEYVRHALLQERHVAHSQLAIGLLTKAHDQYKKLPHAGRVIYQLGGEMADEYLHVNDLSNAWRLYDSVAALYRRESWALLLASTLERLRECAQKAGLVQDFVEYSLELASLPLNGNGGGNGLGTDGWDGGKGAELRKQAQEDAVAILSGKGLDLATLDLGAESGDESSETPKPLAIDPASPLLLSITETSPLRTVLSCAALFEQRSAQPGQPVKLTIAFLSRLPSTLTPFSIEVIFSDPSCNVTLSSTQPPLNLMDETAPPKPTDPVNLALNPLEWQRFSVDVTPSASGRLECQAVTLTLGPNARLRCQAESLVGGEILVPFWMYEPHAGGSPFSKPLAALGASRVLEVGEAPADVDVAVDFGGEPGLVGEVMPVRVLVTSKGDKVSGGKLNLELVGLAPKPGVSASDALLVDLGSEAAVVEVLPAELLIRKGSADRNASRETPSVWTADLLQPSEISRTSETGAKSDGGTGSDVARSESKVSDGGNEYERFSGQLAVPEIEAGSEWAGELFVRWTQAADAGLAVTISYEAEKEGSPVRHSKVRKVVLMRGEEPLSISHRWVAPFRKDALLPAPPTATSKLPINEEVLLSVSIRSSSTVSIQVNKLVLNLNPEAAEESGRGSNGEEGLVSLLDGSGAAGTASENKILQSEAGQSLRPGEALSRLFRVRPRELGESVAMGSLVVTWQRHEDVPRGSSVQEPAAVVSDIPLAPVSVESPPVIVETRLPAYALLGVPFTVTVNVTNGSELLQEVTYSVADAPNFVLGGSHNGQVIILPRSEKSMVYRVVPIQAGLLTLPQMRFTAVRHNAKLIPTTGNAKIFVYPSLQQVDKGHGAVSKGVLVAAR